MWFSTVTLAELRQNRLEYNARLLPCGGLSGTTFPVRECTETGTDKVIEIYHRYNTLA